MNELSEGNLKRKKTPPEGSVERGAGIAGLLEIGRRSIDDLWPETLGFVDVLGNVLVPGLGHTQVLIDVQLAVNDFECLAVNLEFLTEGHAVGTEAAILGRIVRWVGFEDVAIFSSAEAIDSIVIHGGVLGAALYRLTLSEVSDGIVTGENNAIGVGIGVRTCADETCEAECDDAGKARDRFDK